MQIEIFKMRSLPLEERPEINNLDPRKVWIDDLDDLDVIRDRMPALPPQRFEVFTDNGLGSEWDFLGYGGVIGFLSERLFFKLSEFSGESFWGLPVLVDKAPYYVPLKRTATDCLDEARSDIKYFNHKPDVIMWINKFKFVPERVSDPMAFCTPDNPVGEIFVTNGVKQAIESMGVFGVDFRLLDTIG